MPPNPLISFLPPDYHIRASDLETALPQEGWPARVVGHLLDRDWRLVAWAGGTGVGHRGGLRGSAA